MSLGWMVTFADLVSLLLTFFVMLFAMTQVEAEPWKSVVTTLSVRLSPLNDEDPAPAALLNISALSRERAINLDYLKAVLDEQISRDPILRKSIMTRYDDRLVISLPSDSLFASASATATEPARQALFVLGGVLRNIGNQVEVFGHTDPRPIHGGAFRSNWELSLGRAISVSNELRRAGYARQIVPYGHGPSRFADISAELSSDKRFALARRVDVVVAPTMPAP